VVARDVDGWIEEDFKMSRSSSKWISRISKIREGLCGAGGVDTQLAAGWLAVGTAHWFLC
jgi:hypothetical protein